MLHKQSLMSLLMVSMIASTASAGNKAEIKSLIKQIDDSTRALKSGIRDESKSVNDLIEISNTMIALIEKLSPLVAQDRDFVDTLLYKKNIVRNDTNYIRSAIRNAKIDQNKDRFNKAVKQMEEELLPHLRRSY